jgi:N-acetylglucosamine kinase-like BadF-type ATPase
MRALFLAVDGGNSKTDVVLGTAAGEVLGFVRGPTSSPHNVGLDGSMRVLGSLIAEVRTLAGIATEIDLVAVYLAGADLPIEVAELQKAVAAQGWARRSIVDNDCFAVMRAGTSMPDAVAVVCGAGTNCVGRAADGRTARFPALGPISGDWGGGHDLAEYALRYAARGEDGRGAPTALTAAVARHFGRPTVESVSIALHLGELEMSAVPTLAPVLFEVAAAGDLVAGDLVRRQVEEILAQHRVAAGRLGLLTEPHALVLGGGVLRARHPQLHDQIVAGAVEQAPQVQISVVTTAPVVGAALLAMDALSPTARTPGAAGATPRARTATGTTLTALDAAPTALDATRTAPTTLDTVGVTDAAPTALGATRTTDAAPHALDATGTTNTAPTALDTVGTTDAAPTALDATGTTDTAPTALDAAGTTDAAPHALDATGMTDTVPTALDATGTSGAARAAEQVLRAAMNRPPTPATSIAAAPAAAQSWTAASDGRAE